MRGQRFSIRAKSSLAKSIAKKIELPEPAPQLDHSALFKILARSRSCCSRNCIAEFCTVESKLSIDMFGDIIAYAREKIRCMNDEEKRTFVMNEFKRSVRSQSNGKLAFDFWIPLPEKYQNDGAMHLVVCRKAWRLSHGISSYLMDKCSEVYKENPDADGCHLRHRSFTDATNHPYTYGEVSTIMFTNVPEYGTYLLYIFFIL